jgi:hypothetical protein
MRVAVEALASSQEPQLRLYPEQRLAMLLEPGSIEMGWRRSELTRFAYGAGEIILSRRHGETWARSDGLRYFIHRHTAILPSGDVQVNRFPRFTGDQNLLPSSFTVRIQHFGTGRTRF